MSAYLLTEAWKSLTDKVQEARSNAKLKELSFDGRAPTCQIIVLHIIHIKVMYLIIECCIIFFLFLLCFMALSGVNGLRMLGVVHDAVVFLLEQLYGARYCRNYQFRFHKPQDVDEPPLNPHGSARAEVHHRYVSTAFKSQPCVVLVYVWTCLELLGSDHNTFHNTFFG